MKTRVFAGVDQGTTETRTSLYDESGTGHRPLTRAELRIDGARCGGVLPATVAAHLLGHGVRLRRRVVIAGAGARARAIAALVLAEGEEACTVVADDPRGFPPGIAVIAGARIARTHGLAPVEARGRGASRWGRACSVRRARAGRAAASRALVAAAARGARPHTPTALRIGAPR